MPKPKPIPCANNCGKIVRPWELPQDKRDAAYCSDCQRALSKR